MAKSRKPTRTPKTTRSGAGARPKKWKLPEPEYLNWRTFDPSMFANTDNAMVTYRDHLDELLRDEGKYVVIKGHEIIGIYADRQDALIEAATRFGTEPAMVKKIVARERIHYLGGAIF